jgi:2-polyprenyl-3-methyl-5-hydroxy-6-metoxy-1,4-benzoquinol methylase
VSDTGELEVVREPRTVRAPDGSPVEMYKLLPTFGEPELIHGAIRAGAAVLELGCGTGRITGALAALGHPVTAVDSSPEMLAEVTGAETILSRIEDLHLGRTFPCVLLVSNLVNNEDEARRAFLRGCREHVAADGIVIVERMDPEVRSGRSEGAYGPFHIVVEMERVGPDGVIGIVEYSLPDGRHWTHRFGPGGHILDDDAIGVALREEGLELVRIFGPKRRWILAKAA